MELFPPGEEVRNYQSHICIPGMFSA